jgi:hypothetical protein
MANTLDIGKVSRAAAVHGQVVQRRGGRRARRLIALATIAVVALGIGTGAVVNRSRTTAEPVAAPSTLVNPYWEYVEDVPIDAPQAALSNPFAYDPHVYTEWDFREDHRVQVPADASTTGEYRWGPGAYSAPVGPVPAFDWEQQERTQVAPGALPSTPASTYRPWLGTCRSGSVDCLPGEDYLPGQDR